MKKIKKYLCVVFTLTFFITASNLTLAYELTNYYLANKSTQYAWGDNISNVILKNGWLSAVAAWNAEGMNIGYNQNSQNKLEARYRQASAENGMAIVTPYSTSGRSTVKSFVCYMNASKSWTSILAQSTGTHEIGHVIGLDHSYMNRAIMYDGRNRESIYTVQQDDRNGLRAIYN